MAEDIRVAGLVRNQGPNRTSIVLFVTHGQHPSKQAFVTELASCAFFKKSATITKMEDHFIYFIVEIETDLQRQTMSFLQEFCYDYGCELHFTYTAY